MWIINKSSTSVGRWKQIFLTIEKVKNSNNGTILFSSSQYKLINTDDCKYGMNKHDSKNCVQEYIYFFLPPPRMTTWLLKHLSSRQYGFNTGERYFHSLQHQEFYLIDYNNVEPFMISTGGTFRKTGRGKMKISFNRIINTHCLLNYVYLLQWDLLKIYLYRNKWHIANMSNIDLFAEYCSNSKIFHP